MQLEPNGTWTRCKPQTRYTLLSPPYNTNVFLLSNRLCRSLRYTYTIAIHIWLLILSVTGTSTATCWNCASAGPCSPANCVSGNISIIFTTTLTHSNFSQPKFHPPPAPIQQHTPEAVPPPIPFTLQVFTYKLLFPSHFLHPTTLYLTACSLTHLSYLLRHHLLLPAKNHRRYARYISHYLHIYASSTSTLFYYLQPTVLENSTHPTPALPADEQVNICIRYVTFLTNTYYSFTMNFLPR